MAFEDEFGKFFYVECNVWGSILSQTRVLFHLTLLLYFNYIMLLLYLTGGMAQW